MPQFLITWLATAASLFVTAIIVPGLAIAGAPTALVGAAVLGFVNAVVKPILVIFTLPLTVLTLGLFLLVVNAIALGLVGYLTPGFTVGGFFPAVIGSLVLTFVSSLINQLLGQETEELQ
ncbi:MAG: phage holin family protein [Limnothrix sp. RL_2_0]|nr:phage holin family protein [Limnothrix sp. RL_2_0]